MNRDGPTPPSSLFHELPRRGQDQGALVRVLTWDEAHGEWAGCMWIWKDEPNCESTPCFRLATPHGHMDFCRDHIDPMIAALPPEWIAQWEHRDPAPGEESDDLPF